MTQVLDATAGAYDLLFLYSISFKFGNILIVTSLKNTREFMSVYCRFHKSHDACIFLCSILFIATPQTTGSQQTTNQRTVLLVVSNFVFLASRGTPEFLSNSCKRNLDCCSIAILVWTWVYNLVSQVFFNSFEAFFDLLSN